MKHFEFDSFLGIYQQENITAWKECSNYINQEVLDKIDPLEKKLISIEEEYKE